MDGKQTLSALRSLLAMVDENKRGVFTLRSSAQALRLGSLLSLMFDSQQRPRAMSPGYCLQVAGHLIGLLDVEVSDAFTQNLYQQWAAALVCDAAAATPARTGEPEAGPQAMQQSVCLLLGQLAEVWAVARDHAQVDAVGAAREEMAARSASLFREMPATVANDLMLAILNVLSGFRVPFDQAKAAIAQVLQAEDLRVLLAEIDQALGHEMRTFISWAGEAPKQATPQADSGGHHDQAGL